MWKSGIGKARQNLAKYRGQVSTFEAGHFSRENKGNVAKNVGTRQGGYEMKESLSNHEEND